MKSRGLDVQGVVKVDNADVQQIRAARVELIQGFNETLMYPLQLVPSGWRSPDVSVFGVRDVAMNAYELLQPNFAHRAVEIAFKQLPELLIRSGMKQRYVNLLGDGAALVFAYPIVPLASPYFMPGDPRPRYLNMDKATGNLDFARRYGMQHLTKGFASYETVEISPEGAWIYPDWRVGVPADRNGFRCAL